MKLFCFQKNKRNKRSVEISIYLHTSWELMGILIGNLLCMDDKSSVNMNLVWGCWDPLRCKNNERRITRLPPT